MAQLKQTNFPGQSSPKTPKNTSPTIWIHGKVKIRTPLGPREINVPLPQSTIVSVPEDALIVPHLQNCMIIFCLVRTIAVSMPALFVAACSSLFKKDHISSHATPQVATTMSYQETKYLHEQCRTPRQNAFLSRYQNDSRAVFFQSRDKFLMKTFSIT